MNSDEYTKIIKLLDSLGKTFLITNYLSRRKYSEVINILKMPEWEDEKFQGLLTSSIWRSN